MSEEEKLDVASGGIKEDKDESDAKQLYEMMGAIPKGKSLEQMRQDMFNFLEATGGIPSQIPLAHIHDTPDAHGDLEVQQQSTDNSKDTKFYKLPLFSGEEAKGEVSFDLWSYEVQCLLEAGKPLDIIGLSIRRSLRGKAAKVIMNTDPKTTPQLIIKKLRSLYGVVEDQDILLENFLAARQTAGESVADWAVRLEDLLRQAVPSITKEERNKRLHNKLWSGLRDELKDITGHKHDTISDYEELCIAIRNIERNREKRIQERTTSDRPKTTSSATAKVAVEVNERKDLRATVDQLAMSVKRLEKQNSQLLDTVNKMGQDAPGRNCGYRYGGNYNRGRGRGRRYFAGPGVEERGSNGHNFPSRTDKIICWRCKQPGHYRSECTVKLDSNRDLNIQKSGRGGHSQT